MACRIQYRATSSVIEVHDTGRISTGGLNSSQNWLTKWGKDSVFLASDESAASAAYKEAVLGSSDTSSALTKAFTGRWARGIKNGFMDRVKQSGISTLYYTYQNSLTATIRSHGQEHNLSEFISLWAGQSAGRSRRGKASDVFLNGGWIGGQYLQTAVFAFNKSVQFNSSAFLAK